MRKTMVEEDYSQLSVRAQSELLGVNRNRLKPAPEKAWAPKAEHARILQLALIIHAKGPTMGARQMKRVLERNGLKVTRWLAGKVMKFLGLRAIYCKPRTTVPAKENPKYPYLLRGLEVTTPDEVWAVDITYIPWREKRGQETQIDFPKERLIVFRDLRVRTKFRTSEQISSSVFGLRI